MASERGGGGPERASNRTVLGTLAAPCHRLYRVPVGQAGAPPVNSNVLSIMRQWTVKFFRNIAVSSCFVLCQKTLIAVIWI